MGEAEIEPLTLYFYPLVNSQLDFNKQCIPINYGNRRLFSLILKIQRMEISFTKCRPANMHIH